MIELAPGIRYWIRDHPNIGQPVSSYLLDAGVALNPLLPDGGIEALHAAGGVHAVLMTNRHHVRDVDAILDAFPQATLHVPEAGVAEVGRDALPYRSGDALPGGGVAVEVGVLSDDEAAVHFPLLSALAVADGVIREGDGPLTFVPDFLIGDDPEAVKDGLRAAFARLAELEPEHLLLAHGAPVAGGAADALRRFAEA